MNNSLTRALHNLRVNEPRAPAGTVHSWAAHAPAGASAAHAPAGRFALAPPSFTFGPAGAGAGASAAHAPASLPKKRSSTSKGKRIPRHSPPPTRRIHNLLHSKPATRHMKAHHKRLREKMGLKFRKQKPNAATLAMPRVTRSTTRRKRQEANFLKMISNKTSKIHKSR
jgi:hypothetical protein